MIPALEPAQLIPVRQRITTNGNVVLADDDKTLGDYGVKEDDVLSYKDLGRQISWRTVFVIEYVRLSVPLQIISRMAWTDGSGSILTSASALVAARTAAHPPAFLLRPQLPVRRFLQAVRREDGPLRDV